MVTLQNNTGVAFATPVLSNFSGMLPSASHKGQYQSGKYQDYSDDNYCPDPNRGTRFRCRSWWLRRFRLSIEAEHRAPLTRSWFVGHDAPEVSLVALHRAGVLVSSCLYSCRYQRAAHVSILGEGELVLSCLLERRP